MRKIFTGLDFGGRRIKGAKIDGQPYYIPFNFNDANKTNPVPQEVIKTIASMFSSTIGTNELPVFYLYFGDVPIPQVSVLMQCDVEGDVITTIIFISIANNVDMPNESIFQSVKQLMINGTDGSWELEELPFSSGGSGTSFYTLDLDNYTTDIFNELSAMTLGTTIQVIDKSGRPILCQLADIEQDYIILNSYMQYDDSDEDPHIIAYTLNADGTLQDPIERIKLETTGGGTKFLSDLGDYREIKNNDTYNVVTDNYTSEHFNELLDAINNKKSVFVDGVAMTPMMASSDMILLLSNVQYVRETISSETSSKTKHILSTNTYSFLPDGTYETGGETLPINGNGTKFLSDDGTYKEVKTSDLTNTKVTQEEYNALEAAGTLDANTIYYIIG